eukprot:CAMPEP_0175661508 /NCGR_PEP_ID=MMETSP0097-20121207/14994_1 /TAXON_ID=311494 /ORGANISM="Alexandrium monilatum, Strain CCMP3105" /LENGTH=496 /DNA_ID=CAMNT_0016967681 /DNA_START=166 /DNA_END=1654 /DNA_ORIENTATION=+
MSPDWAFWNLPPKSTSASASQLSGPPAISSSVSSAPSSSSRAFSLSSPRPMSTTSSRGRRTSCAMHPASSAPRTAPYRPGPTAGAARPLGTASRAAPASRGGRRHAAGVVPETTHDVVQPARVERLVLGAEDQAGDAVLLGLGRVALTAHRGLYQLPQPARRHLRLPHVEELRVDQLLQRHVREVRLGGHDHLGERVQLREQRPDLLNGARASARPLGQQVRLAQQDHVCKLYLVQQQLRNAAVVGRGPAGPRPLATGAFAAPAGLACAGVADHARDVPLRERLQAAEHVVDVQRIHHCRHRVQPREVGQRPQRLRSRRRTLLPLFLGYVVALLPLPASLLVLLVVGVDAPAAPRHPERGVLHVHHEGLRHGERLRDASGLDHEVIERLLFAQGPHRLQQVAAQRAADAAVVQLHHGGLLEDQPRVLDLRRIQVHLAHVVDNYSHLERGLARLPALAGVVAFLGTLPRRAQNVLQQRGLAGTQEAGEHCHRQQLLA